MFLSVVFLILLFAVPIGMLVWFGVLVNETFSPRGDRSLGQHLGRLAVRWGLWSMATLFIVAMFWPQRGAREAARRASCKNNLKQIGFALHNYHSRFEQFPPAYTTDPEGRPLHSWRTLLLPYMEQKELYDQLRLDEPWDSEHNRAVFDERGSWSYLYCTSSHDDRSVTNYVMVVGPGTASDGPNGVCIDDVTDGLSRTIMVVEVTGSGIHWAEPRDLDFDTMSFKINDPAGTGISSEHPGVANVLFADGSVHMLGNELSPELLRGLLTVAGGEDVAEFFSDE